MTRQHRWRSSDYIVSVPSISTMSCSVDRHGARVPCNIDEYVLSNEAQRRRQSSINQRTSSEKTECWYVVQTLMTLPVYSFRVILVD